MQACNCRDKWQAEAASLGMAATFSAVKAPQYSLALVCRNAGPVIRDVDAQDSCPG